MNADAQVVGDHAEVVAEFFAMLADPTRVRIIAALRAEEFSVNPLARICLLYTSPSPRD